MINPTPKPARFITSYSTDNPAQIAKCADVADVIASLTFWHPFKGCGAYITFMMEKGADRIRSTYGENYDRLSAIKANTTRATSLT
jgi:hypothetical protein